MCTIDNTYENKKETIKIYNQTKRQFFILSLFLFIRYKRFILLTAGVTPNHLGYADGVLTLSANTDEWFSI